MGQVIDRIRNRQRIMSLLARHGPVTSTVLGEVTGLSPSALQSHLKELTKAGAIGCTQHKGRDPATYYSKVSGDPPTTEAP